MKSIIRKNRFCYSLPLSRSDNNSGANALNKNKNEKSSINSNNENINEYDEENNENFNDVNYWEIKNELIENIKKEVDKKTNILFNYNHITGENDKKTEISEENELLLIAMGLEQKEKMKKKMYIMPGKLRPINLKTKSNPVQNIYLLIYQTITKLKIN